jgi:outer membrane protein assembly factor BamB
VPSTEAGAGWLVALGRGTGALRLDVPDGLVVAQVQDGRTVSIDVETGSPCAVLVDASLPGAARPIDPFAPQSRVAHGALVGPSELSVAAVDLWSGAVRWRRELSSPELEGDQYDIRDGLRVVPASAAIVIGFPLRYRTPDRWFRYEEIVAALEPATGRELWRKTVVEHPPNTWSPPGRWSDPGIELVSDGERVAVRERARLRVLSAATGEELWAATWTPPVAVPGWVTPDKLAPLVAGDGGHFALAFPGRIELYDARSGARSRDVAVAGAATELVARRGVLYAALEATPGTAAVAAIDMASARTRWTYTPAYSVQRLRADDELVYVLDGNDRLWGLRLDDGQPRFGVDARGFDVAVARTRTGAPRAVALRGYFAPFHSLAAFDPAPGPAAPLEPFLRWELQAGGGCQPAALSWIAGDGQVAWQRAVPGRLSGPGLGGCDERQMNDYRRRPRVYPGLPHWGFGVVDMGSAIVDVDATGLLALRKADGAVLLDAEAPSGDIPLYPGGGGFELRGLPGCRGELRGLFARCGDRLLYFNGTGVLLVALGAMRVEARALVTDRMTTRRRRGNVVEYRASIPLGAFSLALGIDVVEPRD